MKRHILEVAEDSCFIYSSLFVVWFFVHLCLSSGSVRFWEYIVWIRWLELGLSIIIFVFAVAVYIYHIKKRRKDES